MVALTASPIIILTLKDANNNVFYKAFSPSNYIAPSEDQRGDRDYSFEEFENKVYEHIQYNINGIDNTTNLGALLEVHSRFNGQPVEQRGNTIWFSTYQNPYTTYMCVHRQSPINYSEDSALSYAAQQPELGHTNCEHIIL
jgi:hypothetical protein